MLIKKRFLNKKLRTIAGLMIASVVIGGSLFTLPIDNAKSAGSPYPPTDSENWNPEPIWRDEFNGTSLDRTKWDYYTGGWKDENQQVQNCYRAKSENVNVSGGSLNLVGLYKPGETCTGNSKTGDFTSGFVQTKGKANASFKYGYIEARIKMPKNKSTWPGFWMSPSDKKYGEWPNSGEIDIVEAKGSNYQFAASDAHWRDKNTPTGQAGGHRSRQGVIPSTKFSTNNNTEWHTYGVKWTEGKLEYFIDGEWHHTIDNFKNSNSAGTPYGPFDQNFFLRLNLAIGGNYIDTPWNDAHNSVGAADDFPATMSIDYVRVYEMRKPKEVNVSDNNLRKLLNKKLGEKLGTTRADNQKITDVELEKLTDLNLDNSNITNLTGIEAAKNLQNLSLNRNSISDLSPLSNLTSIKTLSLKENAITDISPLTRLTSLTSLHLEDQRANTKTNNKSFTSPLRDFAGNVVNITDSADVINDTETAGNIKLLTLPPNGASSVLHATWTRSVTIGAVSATFSGYLAIDTLAILRAVQPAASVPATTQSPANKPEGVIGNLLANTGVSVILGIVAALSIAAVGLFILR